MKKIAKDRKITIGLFNDSFYPMSDGVVMVVDNYARRLSKYANVIVFVPSYLNKSYDDSKFPYEVVRCNSLKVPFLDYSLPIPKLDRKFTSILNKYKLDIVHIHSPFTLGVAGLKYAKRHHIPCIATMHSQFKQDFQKAVKSDLLATKLNNKLMKTFNKCDECWAVNSEVAKLYYEDYKCKKYPRVMNNATEMEAVKDIKKAHRYINKKHNIKFNEKVFLFVGRINTLKNIIFIVDALKAVKYKNPKLKFKMLYVGTGQDEQKLKNHIKQLKMEQDIILCGKITDREELKYYYSRADLFLFPSVYDASSIVQIEAASQSTPALLLKNTVTAGTVTDNINGFLSDHTIGAYSVRIIEIMSNKSLYERVCKNAYIDLYKNWDETVDKAYRLYIETIYKKKHIKNQEK
ncbi:MAG: glycosyltransferase [Bacilli bacterium]|nr:glycosyltransferase [Bacilli bacterium]